MKYPNALTRNIITIQKQKNYAVEKATEAVMLHIYFVEKQISVQTLFHPYEKIEAQPSIKRNYANVSEKYANVPDQDSNPYVVPDVNPYVDPDVLRG